MQAEPIEILLVEDNPGDVELTREAFEDMRLSNNLYVARDGEEALDFIYQRNGYENSVRPDLILLDLNLPRMNGQEVLDVLKKDPKYKTIPTVVLTSSQAEKDILESYKLHCNSYIVKPVNMTQFHEVVESIRQFWFQVVKLPMGEDT
ncbi:MAG: two-component system response regulator [Rickettsiales bacterium]|nr:two-component system response regulator [Rickettsiales bacterium]|tara:strand:+ start:321 stop:764 length:444 start_codon:yes stop_codon:yes gene_type:complete